MTSGRARGVAAQIGRLGVLTVQLMCTAHLVNQYMFELRMVRWFAP